MKKVSIVTAEQSGNISQQKLTIGLDLGDRNSWYCVLDEAGQIQGELRNGNALSGGGIRNLGTLTLNNSIIANNRALGGGGITNGGTAIIRNSTVQFNVASVPCSSKCLALARGGGISNGGVLRISNSTISHNAVYTPIPLTGSFGSP
jgi:hypothetical protein